MKYINFVLGSVSWIQYFMPIVIAGNKRDIKSIFFVRKNRKKYADPYQKHHFKEIRQIALNYGIILKDLKEIIDFPGLTFLMEGDIVGQQPIDYKTAGMHYLKPYHLKISINFNADFIWSYQKYVNFMDYVILPNKIYAKTYKTLSPKNVYLGSPKFDLELAKSDEIYKKYKLDPKNKYVLFFYPKRKWWKESNILNKHKNKFFDIFAYLKRLGFKIIVKTREKDGLEHKLGDYYFEDLKLYPNSSIELLKIVKFAVFFSSTTIEECVLYNVPFIDFKVDPSLDRYVFLNHPSYSRIIENFNIDFNSFSKIVCWLTNNPSNDTSKAFTEIKEKYLFDMNGISDRILDRFMDLADQKYEEATQLHNKLLELKRLKEKEKELEQKKKDKVEPHLKSSKNKS